MPSIVHWLSQPIVRLLASADRLSLLLLASRLKERRHLLLILQPDTLLRWHWQGFRLFWRWQSQPRRGRACLSQDLITLIQQMAAENPLWGAERIRGELLKLGLHVAKDTIHTYLNRERPSRSPSQDWNIFLKHHAQDAYACDFLPVIDLFFRTAYVFFIIKLGSRRVVHFGVTRHPTDTWVAQQLREATPYLQAPRFDPRQRSQVWAGLLVRGEIYVHPGAAHPISCATDQCRL